MFVRALILSAACLGFAAMPAQAAVISFDLAGTAGTGLLGGNENPARAGGSGGEVGSGISFDDATNILTINVGWGSANGFTDLTGNAVAGHIHGGAVNNGGLTPFTQNRGVRVDLGGLPGFDGNGVSGGFSGSVTISAADLADLFAGALYINIHTRTFPGGEIRGNLVRAPEPVALASMFAGLVLVGGIAARRRKALV